MPTAYLFRHANIHGLPSAFRQAARGQTVVAVNEGFGGARKAIRAMPEWGSRWAGSNGICWWSPDAVAVRAWRRTILPAGGSGKRTWQSSEAIAVLLRIRKTGQEVLHVCTHFPSKGWTSLPHRRGPWKRAHVELRQWVNRIVKQLGRRPPTVISADVNRAGAWTLGAYRLVAYRPTFGSAHYDRVFVRGPVKLQKVHTIKTDSDHKAIGGRLVLRS